MAKKLKLKLNLSRKLFSIVYIVVNRGGEWVRGRTTWIRLAGTRKMLNMRSITNGIFRTLPRTDFLFSHPFQSIYFSYIIST